MNLIPVYDPDDPRLIDYTRLTDVDLRRVREPEEGLYLAESAKVIARALKAGHVPRSVLTLDKWLDDLASLLEGYPELPVYVGEAAVLEKVTGFLMHRGALASMNRPRLASVAEVVSNARRVAVLEHLVDHTNVGAVFRSAAALGVDAVLVSPRCADPLYRRSVRVSMGTVFQVPWTRCSSWPGDLDALKDEGFLVAGLTLRDGAISLDDLVAENAAKLALVFGTEGHGLTSSLEARLDRAVTIPMMNGVDSLNVAASSAVAFYATREKLLRGSL